MSLEGINRGMNTSETVSYTHLDVYKRQVLTEETRDRAEPGGCDTTERETVLVGHRQPCRGFQSRGQILFRGTRLSIDRKHTTETVKRSLN